ncbi:hypothetical protein [Streptomyces sp. NPDC048385]
MINNLLRRFRGHPRTAAAAFACSLPGSLATLPGQAPEVPWRPTTCRP